MALVLLVALQVAFGMLAPGMTFLALLHGLNALVIFATALVAARTVGRVRAAVAQPAMA